MGVLEGIRTFHPDSADQTVVMERNAEDLIIVFVK